MSMKKIFCPLAILALLITSQAFSQDEKNSDAVYLSLVKEYTLNPDGSMIYHFSKEQKLLTYRSFNSLYGETFVIYNPQYQKLTINKAVTTMADGKQVKGPANAFNEVLPGFASNAPDFNMLREMVITHTALERNAVISLDYTIRSEKGFYPALSGNEMISEYEPVKSLTIRIRVPEQQKLSYNLFNFKSEPVKSTEGNFNVFTWNFKNIPAISFEENQPGGYETCPRLVFTTGTDAAAAWSSFIAQPAFKYMLSADMKKMIDKMADATKDKSSLALKIQEKVVNELNLNGIPLRYTGFRLRTPEQVWMGNYGTLAEKAVLLTALLRQAGISAWPAAVQNASRYQEKTTDLYGIDDIIVKAAIPGAEPMWLSVSSINSKDLSHALPGKVFVTLNDDGTVTGTRTDMQEAVISLSGNLFVSNQNTLTGELTASLTGPVNPIYTLKRDNEKARKWFSGGINGEDLGEVKLSQAAPEVAKFTYQLKKENALKKDTMLRRFTIPVLTNGVESWGIKRLPSYRNTPFEVGFPVSESLSLTLTVPDELLLFSQEDEINISNTAGTFVYELKKEAGKIVIKKEINIRKRTMDPAVYGAFKVLMDNWNDPRLQEVIFLAK